ncbi:hypothetical protein FOZ63_026054 [Perkinsus olseni]|uniref:Uncharacterized protein n=1 Tax=Perkinsus olseni TaxID=32597 RepID=A0A7J6QCQ8_PEROL|nr:hypothetical protein FOZ62_024176 [Perkinsus olseni]KAF4757057.1 hypothetical protein FOZ63_026054 [Perkinsus olseni]
MSSIPSMAVDDIENSPIYPLAPASVDTLSSLRTHIWSKNPESLSFNTLCLPSLRTSVVHLDNPINCGLVFRRLCNKQCNGSLYRRLAYHQISPLPNIDSKIYNLYEVVLAGYKLHRGLFVDRIVWLSIPPYLQTFIYEGTINASASTSPLYTNPIYKDSSNHGGYISTIGGFLRLTVVLGLLGFLYRDLEVLQSISLLKVERLRSKAVVLPLPEELYFSCLRLSALYKNLLLPSIFDEVDGLRVLDLLDLGVDSGDSKAVDKNDVYSLEEMRSITELYYLDDD